MANEIRVSASMSVSNGALISNGAANTQQYDQASPVAPGPGGMNIGTSEETIDFGDITPGWTEITNLDLSNHVDFGFSSGVYGITVPAQATVVFKMADGATMYAKADTAACEVFIRSVND